MQKNSTSKSSTKSLSLSEEDKSNLEVASINEFELVQTILAN